MNKRARFIILAGYSTLVWVCIGYIVMSTPLRPVAVVALIAILALVIRQLQRPSIVLRQQELLVRSSLDRVFALDELRRVTVAKGYSGLFRREVLVVEFKNGMARSLAKEGIWARVGSRAAEELRDAAIEIDRAMGSTGQSGSG